MIGRIKYYWERTKKTMLWRVAYRKRTSNETILTNAQGHFHVLSVEKNTWAADPFLYQDRRSGKNYIFMELFEIKKNKGLIAVATENNGIFSTPEIVLEEPFHLSFPCIFEIDGITYMVPECGSQHSIILYSTDTFPYGWKKVKTLLTQVNSSDTIVWKHNGEVYFIASFLIENACTAENILYRFDSKNKCLEQIYQIPGYGDKGFRNAGMILELGENIFRPGQNCDNNQYGKSLYFWKIINDNPQTYQEQFYKEVQVNDIEIDDNEVFCGVHTYNSTNEFEVIDLKVLQDTALINRIRMISRIIIDYLKGNILKAKRREA